MICAEVWVIARQPQWASFLLVLTRGRRKPSATKMGPSGPTLSGRECMEGLRVAVVGPAGYAQKKRTVAQNREGGRGLSGHCLTTTVVNLCHGSIFTTNCSGHCLVCCFYFQLQNARRWKLIGRPKRKGMQTGAIDIYIKRLLFALWKILYTVYNAIPREIMALCS